MLNPSLRPPLSFSLMQTLGQDASAEAQQLTNLRRMIWLYFALLIAEGALRKWIVPSLSAPLLVVRDPIVLLIYMQAIRCRRFPFNGPMVTYFLLFSSFIVLALYQIIAGIGGGPLVAAYGLRTNFLHLPLIFVIPQVFSYDDVLKIGRWILVLSVPMAALMAWQYLSPPDSFINAATSADAQQISFAMGKIRPAGTFSFATGAAHFYVLATAFLIYGLVQPRATYSRWLLAAALISVLVVQPVSGSRLLVIGCALVLVAGILFVPLSGRGGLRILVTAALICAAFAALSLTSFFGEAITVFMVRWNDAGDGNASMTLASRIFSIFIEPLHYLPEAGLFGKGIGLGTNAASALMTGTSQFLLAEGEWSRVVLEAGPLLGFSFLIYRAWMAGDIAVRAARAATRQHLLAWLLAWDACRSLVAEPFSQPTNLGFAILVSGLCLAAMPAECRAPTAELAATGSPSALRALRFKVTVRSGG